MAFDSKGNYVLIAVMTILKFEETQTYLNEIIDILIPQIPSLVSDQLGICVVNKII